LAKSSFSILLFLLFLFAQTILAQDNYYFVSFENKEGNGFNINQPETFLSAKAINRRLNQGINIYEQDLPITPSYKTTIGNQGVEVFESSKWFNGIIIKSTAIEAEQLKNLSFVSTITYLAPQNYAGRRSSNQEELAVSDAPTDTLFQNEILNVKEMHSQGYLGQGIRIAVLDGGFRNVDNLSAFGHLYSQSKLDYTYDFVSKTSNVYQHSDHGTKVLSFMTALIPDSYQGVAPEASYMLFVTENVPSEYRIEEYYWLIAAERADSAGVDIINTSLGYNIFDDPQMNYTQEEMDGNTTVVAKAAHIASEKGIIVVASAGNEGNKAWSIITSPADVRDGLAVGSIQTDYGRSGFSSLGPSANGQIKPDVVAMGSSAFLINESGAIIRGSGTSFSAPQVAGLMAGIWQAYPDFSAIELLDAVRMSSSNATTPDNEIGYGIPSFIAINNYLESISDTEPIMVYPNPIMPSELLKIKIANPSKVNEAQFELFETSGKKLSSNLFTVSWSNNIASIELQHLSQGLYFLNVLYESDNKPESYKVRIIKL